MEELLVVVIVFGSALAALKLILDHLQSRRVAKGASVGQSLTTSELSSLIDDSVAKSVKHLEKRIENLEAIVVDQPVTPASPPRLSVPDEDEYVPGGREQGRERTR